MVILRTREGSSSQPRQEQGTEGSGCLSKKNHCEERINIGMESAVEVWLGHFLGLGRNIFFRE